VSRVASLCFSSRRVLCACTDSRIYLLSFFFCDQVHRCLGKSFRLWGRGAEAEAAEVLARGDKTNAEQGRLVYKYLQRYTAIINHVFILRTNAWFELVLKQGVGITDYWYRFEFAKSRGAIHFHALLFKTDASKKIGNIVNQALAAANLEHLEGVEAEIARRLPDVFAEHLVPLTCMHPAGEVRSNPGVECNTQWYQTRVAVAKGEAPAEVAAKVCIGPSPPCTHVGNVDCYPKPEGCAGQPSSVPLQTKTCHVPDTLAAERQDLVDFVNRVLLHECSAYCLRWSDHAAAFCCRFGFWTREQALQDPHRRQAVAARTVSQH
jgi:hypothetical protein